MSGTFTDTRARLASPGYSPPERRVLWKMSGGRCFWCDRVMAPGGDPFARAFMTSDHLHPRGYGLSRKLKVAACRECNMERGDMSPEAYWLLWARRLVA